MIKNLVGFTQYIQRFDQVLPGDIVAMRDIGAYTGHTATVISVNSTTMKPYLMGLANSNSKWENTTYYEMTVVDCSSDKHSADTRNFFNSQGILLRQTQGVGIGIMGVLVDSNFNVVAHTWSLPGSGDYYGNLTKQNQWIGSLNNKLKDQSSPGGREMVFGRLSLP